MCALCPDNSNAGKRHDHRSVSTRHWLLKDREPLFLLMGGAVDSSLATPSKAAMPFCTRKSRQQLSLLKAATFPPYGPPCLKHRPINRCIGSEAGRTSRRARRRCGAASPMAAMAEGDPSHRPAQPDDRCAVTVAQRSAKTQEFHRRQNRWSLNSEGFHRPSQPME
jgi:hypothetical protein